MGHSCRCEVRAELRGAMARNGSHALCHCADCQAFAKSPGVVGVLDRNGGSAIYRALAGRLAFARGKLWLALAHLRISVYPAFAAVPFSGIWRVLGPAPGGSPLFNGGKPVVAPHVLTVDRCRAAYDA
ncbi:MAG: hypothetical protein OXE82_09390 [Rhodobacter sp.]|nr:hypothetical protein [Rhodobacter sp.]